MTTPLAHIPLADLISEIDRRCQTKTAVPNWAAPTLLKVAKFYEIPLGELISNRTRATKPARSLAIYLLRKKGYQLLNISQIWGQGHSNAAHVCRKFKAQLLADPVLKSKIEML